MLFSLLKAYARLCLRIYCRKLVINKPAYLRVKGPVLFAANHPNSFLDGIILTTLMQETLYALARGDAFKGKKDKWLRSMHLLPVYRTSEGVENLAHNYTTFSACHQVFEQGGLVLIFSEGYCLNEWRLRPLRKGTARLAVSAWEKGIDLTVIPVGFNYSSFKSFGKNVHVLFGEPIQKEMVLAHVQEGKQLSCFNEQLKAQLAQLVYEIDPHDKETLKNRFDTFVPFTYKLLFAPPAVLGWLLHAPLYFLAKSLAARFEKEHYDSIVAGTLLLLYPVYLILLTVVASAVLGSWALLLFFLLPLCAAALVRVKPLVY